jgi:UDP-2,4-diacetamido-2,4,6-trideoxy-beta-L-altropyranose hydrolase
MRCLTLADAMHSQGSEVTFVSGTMPDSLASLVTSHGHELLRIGRHTAGQATAIADQDEDARQTQMVLAARRSDWHTDWLIVDHYSLDSTWERLLRPATDRILVIDDLADRPHDCDVLLDQNLYVDSDTRYASRVPESCRLLLGPRFALLREEFRHARAHARARAGTVRRVLVFFGGGDATNRTALVLQALAALLPAQLAVDVVIGTEHAARGEIEALCRTHSFDLHVQTQHMSQLMLAADLALGAGGSATWERCCLGLPCMTVSVADNQAQLVHDCALAGILYAPQDAFSDPGKLARHIQSLLENPLLRQSISCKALDTVDGHGAGRVLRSMGLVNVSVRPAILDDAANLLEWRNHPTIRQVSRSAAPIDRAAHDRWLAHLLGDPSRVLLIGEAASGPVGVVRFDSTEDGAEVSIYLVPGLEQPGMGSRLLAAAEDWLGRNRPEIRQIRAEVLSDNQPSHRLFAAAGYRLDSSVYTKRVH